MCSRREFDGACPSLRRNRFFTAVRARFPWPSLQVTSATSLPCSRCSCWVRCVKPGLRCRSLAPPATLPSEAFADAFDPRQASRWTPSTRYSFPTTQARAASQATPARAAGVSPELLQSPETAPGAQGSRPRSVFQDTRPSAVSDSVGRSCCSSLRGWRRTTSSLATHTCSQASACTRRGLNTGAG